jgi:hypothetical protein
MSERQQVDDLIARLQNATGNSHPFGLSTVQLVELATITVRDDVPSGSTEPRSVLAVLDNAAVTLDHIADKGSAGVELSKRCRTVAKHCRQAAHALHMLCGQ